MAHLMSKCLQAGLDAYNNQTSLTSAVKAQVACVSFKQHCSSRILLIIGRFADEPIESIKLMLAQMVVALILRDIAYRSSSRVQKLILALVMVFLWHLLIEEYI